MTSTFFNRRMLMGHLAAGLSALGVGSLLAATAEAKTQGFGRSQTESRWQAGRRKTDDHSLDHPQ